MRLLTAWSQVRVLPPALDFKVLSKIFKDKNKTSSDFVHINIEKKKEEIDTIIDFFEKVLKGEIRHRLFDRKYREKLRRVHQIFIHPLRQFIFIYLYINHSLDYEDLKEIGFSKQLAYYHLKELRKYNIISYNERLEKKEIIVDGVPKIIPIREKTFYFSQEFQVLLNRANFILNSVNSLKLVIKQLLPFVEENYFSLIYKEKDFTGTSIYDLQQRYQELLEEEKSKLIKIKNKYLVTKLKYLVIELFLERLELIKNGSYSFEDFVKLLSEKGLNWPKLITFSKKLFEVVQNG